MTGVQTCALPISGFKFIGEQILYLEQKNETDRFILGFEESYGYLVGTYVRDKDAVVASMLIVEMAAYYNSIGSSLLEALEEIYKKFGRYLHKVDAFDFEGLSGMDKMKEIMAELRANPPKEVAGFNIVKIADYSTHKIMDIVANTEETINLPGANVLIYSLDNGATFIVRPSGTEPKIKVYYSTKGDDLDQAEKLRAKIAESVVELLGFGN